MIAGPHPKTCIGLPTSVRGPEPAPSIFKSCFLPDPILARPLLSPHFGISTTPTNQRNNNNFGSFQFLQNWILAIFLVMHPTLLHVQPPFITKKMCWSFKQSKILFRVQQKCISTALACSACSVLCSVLIVRAASLMIFLSLNFTWSYVFRNIGEWHCKLGIILMLGWARTRSTHHGHARVCRCQVRGGDGDVLRGARGGVVLLIINISTLQMIDTFNIESNGESTLKKDWMEDALIYLIGRK